MWRLVSLLLLVGLFNVVPVQAATDTPTSTPTATDTGPTSTATVTSTPSPTANLYAYSTIPASGQAVAVVYTFTAGEVFSGILQMVTVSLLLFIALLLLLRRND